MSGEADGARMGGTSRSVLLFGAEWLPNAPGGLNRYFHGLVQCAARTGLDARAVVTFLRSGQSAPVPISPMAPEGAPLLRRLRGARQQALAALKDGLALANTHFALYAWPWIGRLGRVPLVANFHGPWSAEMLAECTAPRTRMKAAVARAIECSVLRRAARCIVLSAHFGTVLQRDYGIGAERVVVVPGGADLGPFRVAPSRMEARRVLGWPEDRPIVLAVRRLARRMGLDLLIEATAQVRRELPGVLVLIAGRGPMAARLEMSIEAAGLRDNVRLLGFVQEDQLPLMYAAADLTVLPSVSLEGFGLTIVESLAAGTPAICTPVGGMPEVVGPLDPGLLAERAEAGAIADTISRILAGRQPVPDGARCREYAARFDWSVVFPRILSVWREAGARL